MRLIDADSLREKAKHHFVSPDCALMLIDSQPTVYDVDNVVEQLREISIPEDNILYLDPDKFGVYVRLEDAEKIIKVGLNQ